MVDGVTVTFLSQRITLSSLVQIVHVLCTEVLKLVYDTSCADDNENCIGS